WCTPASTAGTTTTWRTEGFTFRRTMTFQGEDRLEVGLSVVNTGRIPLPHFWSSHDMLPLTEHTRLELPPGTPIRIFSAHGFLPAPGEHAWPRLGTLDLSHPARLRAELGRDFAFKLFSVEDAGPLKVREGDRELELSGPGTRAGLWVNWEGWAPESLRARGVRYQSLCPERCIGGPTDLPSEGLAMGTTRWIEPGEERAWAYEYLGR
ncbi:MAG TPA: hypothetical protein VND93_32130, partial [Myxococcales bacterium]|nr:hypothetical protein [Myxococcales bacterium]